MGVCIYAVSSGCLIDDKKGPRTRYNLALPTTPAVLSPPAIPNFLKILPPSKVVQETEDKEFMVNISYANHNPTF